MGIERKTAYEALYAVEKEGAYSNIALNNSIEKFTPDDEAFVRRLVYGVLENQIYIDERLSKLVKSGLKKIKPQILVILRMGAYQIDFMDSVPAHAAVNESVKLAKKSCRGLEGFVNGVLRSYIRMSKSESESGRVTADRESEQESGCKAAGRESEQESGCEAAVRESEQKSGCEAAGRESEQESGCKAAGFESGSESECRVLNKLASKYSYTKDIAKMWIDMFGEDEAEKLMAVGNERPPLTVRVNKLRADRKKLIRILKSKGFGAEPRMDCEGIDISGSGVLSTPEATGGLFAVQDAASQIMIESILPKPGDIVIDLCAAPGGKSIAAAEMMGDRGKVISCDIYEKKLELIKKNAARQGVHIIEAIKNDALKLNHDFENLADIVIADAPCSGLGVVRRKPEIKLHMHMDDVEKLADIQSKILDNAASYVKDGGKLVYSTCTISRQENFRVAGQFLQKHSEFYIEDERQLMPHTHGTDGFYFCIMRKDKNRTVSAAEMKAIEKRADEDGFPYRQMMENAGTGAFELMRKLWPGAKRAVIFCGKGNNAGDGFVIARLCAESKMRAEVVLCDGIPVTIDSKYNFELLKDKKYADFITITDIDSYVASAAELTSEAASFTNEAAKLTSEAVSEAVSEAASDAASSTKEKEADTDEVASDASSKHRAVAVDAIYGTGFHGEFRGKGRIAADAINSFDGPIFALDLPSGMNADTGETADGAVKADATVSFHILKNCHVAKISEEYCGNIIISKIFE